MAASTATPLPLLVLVGGKAGSGKSTLARRLGEADALGLPVLSRDAIKIGLVETHGAETDAVRATAVPRSFQVFFETIQTWLRAGVSLIAEYGFAWNRYETELRTLFPLARTVIVHSHTSDEVAQLRFIARERANPRARPDILAKLIESMERGTFDWREYDPVDFGVPMLSVDTTQGHTPDVEAIVAFCRTGQAR